MESEERTLPDMALPGKGHNKASPENARRSWKLESTDFVRARGHC